MADAVVPTPPFRTTQIADPKTGVATTIQQNQQQQLWRWATNGIPTIPTSVGGTVNALVLTPKLNNQPITNYTEFMPFGFVPTATSTSAVTVAVSGLSALPAYTPFGTQAGSGGLSIGQLYVAYYCAKNDTLPERFTVFGIAQSVPAQATYAPTPCTDTGSSAGVIVLAPISGTTVASYFAYQSFVWQSSIAYGAATATTVNVNGLGALGWVVSISGGVQNPKLLNNAIYTITLNNTKSQFVTAIG
jgi:hypothetical protein